MNPSSTGNTIALIVGLVAAAATVVVAVINSRQSRRDARDNLNRDIELAKQLQDGSHAKQILDRLISDEIENLALYQAPEMRGARAAMLVFGVIAQAGLITLLGMRIASGDQNLERTLTVASQLFVAIFLVMAAILQRVMSHKKAELEATPRHRAAWVRRIRSALKVERIQSAWKVLTAPEEPKGAAPGS
jgi:hypothetical protein